MLPTQSDIPVPTAAPSLHATSLPINVPCSTPPPATWHRANTVIDPATGASLEYRDLKLGNNATQWLQGASNEIGRLAQGMPGKPNCTNTIHFIPFSNLPAGRTATYLRIVAAYKEHKTEKHRIRFTVGGDRVDYGGPVSTPTAELSTVKCHLNSVVSTPGARYLTADIENFYLNSPMPRYEYMRIPVKDIPDDVMLHYNLAAITHNGYVLVEIQKGMYGLPQAGILAHERLVKHLATSGYHPTPNTPGLFTHTSRPISFTLVVDDFGIKYVGREHAEHLVAAIKSLYTLTTNWQGNVYCGLTLKWNYIGARSVQLSMPGYVAKALNKFRHGQPTRPQHAPHAWLKPNYGAPTQLTDPIDNSAPLDASGLTRLQEIIGTFLYYGRAIDSTMLVALGTLSSQQSKGTQATAQATTQLLNYCATHPDATLQYTASAMQLHVHSDASYLSERKARSRAGGIFFLSTQTPATKNEYGVTVAPKPDSTPPPFNGAIHVHCSIMKVVLSSATEAEMGALFYNAKDAVTLRTTLEDMGHPQVATPIQVDNACAAGIVNNTVKQRRSKAIDMRFYWVRDRVKQGQFLVHWRCGTDNLADYFTKHHSPSHHRLMRSRYLLELHQPKENSSRGCVDLVGRPSSVRSSQPSLGLRIPLLNHQSRSVLIT
jgi:hypothetical protein